ncbi:MAG: SPOR domain-containing protein [Myxococcota bacterium]
MRALGRLVLLVAIGFGVGLVFGLVTEEPELLARHLRGESEPVALREAPGTASSLPGGEADPAVYASAANGARPLIDDAERERTEGLPRVAAPARPASKPPGSPPPVAGSAQPPTRRASASPPAGTRVAAQATVPPSARAQAVRSASEARPWAIQVGAFSEQGAAKRLADSLSGGYPVEVLPAKREGGRWRVRVQPIEGEGLARETADRLKREEGLPTWVTPMEGRSR